MNWRIQPKLEIGQLLWMRLPEAMEDAKCQNDGHQSCWSISSSHLSVALAWLHTETIVDLNTRLLAVSVDGYVSAPCHLIFSWVTCCFVACPNIHKNRGIQTRPEYVLVFESNYEAMLRALMKKIRKMQLARPAPGNKMRVSTGREGG